MDNLANIRELSVKYTLKDRKDIGAYTLLTHLSYTPDELPNSTIHYYLIEKARISQKSYSAEQTVFSSYESNGNIHAADFGSCFSILITMYEYDSEIGREFAFDVTHDKNEAKKLLSLLRRNEVTPCTLQDIIYDYLA